MILLTPELRAALRANAIAHHAAQRDGRREPDPLPVLKLFNPMGAATWLASELDADGSTLFGLADLGFGCPELGYFDLREIEAIRLPGGLGIERDLHFVARFPLSAYAEAARIAGRITEAEALLATVARARALRTPRNSDPEIPPASDG
ncbi:DUF2958 domain-containing protein [Novosphingobium resinovorum]|uniref:DUF2958 domain-containing protein n=1 Tax=Novosphingobium resinovorum TaxID=158500 RepID=UPI002ED011BC|nr:DUF2958 domain-containing protein [Novosphingobium resinovorum]